MRTLAVVLGIVAGAAIALPSLADDTKWTVVRSEDPVVVIGPDADSASLATSLDARHVAWRERRDGKWVVLRDGKASDPWDDVAGATWTADGLHLVHWGKRGDRWYLVVDGMARVVDGKPHWVDERTILPAPVGGRFAALLSHGDVYRVIVDGTDFGPPVLSAPLLVWSPDGRRYAYGTRVEAGAVVFVDGKPSKPVESLGGSTGPVFSPDGNLVGWIVVRGDEWRVAVEGEEGPPFRNVSHLVLGPRGTTVAYAAETEAGWVLVLGDKPGETVYQTISDVVLSANGKHVAFVARKEFRSPDDQTWVVVIDGKEQATVPFVASPTLRLTEDASHHAYVVRRGKQWTVVVDGVESEAWDRVLLPTLVFSPDGRRYAYAARKGAAWRLVADGKSGPDWSEVSDVRFGPPSERGHLVVARVTRDGKPLLWVDGVEIPAEGGGIGVVSFEGPQAVRLVVNDGTKVRLVRAELRHP